VDTLKPDFRTVFVLRDIEELSTEETAETLGISISAVKSRLLRARLALRDEARLQLEPLGIGHAPEVANLHRAHRAGGLG